MRTGVELVADSSPAIATVTPPKHQQPKPHRTLNIVFISVFRFLVEGLIDTQSLSRPARKVLIDKSCSGIAPINDRHAGWNRIKFTDSLPTNWQLSLTVMFVPNLTERGDYLKCSGLRKTLLISMRFEFHE
jgi:hypothetical protein